MEKMTCPHCFGQFEPCDAIKVCGVSICPCCADGSAVWAAISEWRNENSGKPFDLWMLESLDYEVAEDADQPGMWLWVAPHGEASDISFDSQQEAIADAQRHANGSRSKEDKCRLRLTVDVTYDLNGESANAMKSRLYQMVERAIGKGLLTGNTQAEVDLYSMDVTEFPEVDEKAWIDFFAQQMEDGQIHPSGVARRFVQYGLMNPAEFAIEMQERMEMAKEGEE